MLGLMAGLNAPVARAAELEWQPFTAEVFRRAKAERKLVLLDLKAVWCHWCHVMDERTYGDTAVRSILREHFVLVRVDQEAQPDVAARYDDYGWPATILFDADGAELAKLSGFIQPARMVGLLEAFVADPTPGPSVTPEAPLEVGTATQLDPTLSAELDAGWRGYYDPERAGWGRHHKFIHADAVEYALLLAAETSGGDQVAETMARDTLDAALALIDPVWGGLYQYSDSGVWDRPHFEKIMHTQSSGLRLYAEAWRRWKDPRHLSAARRIGAYLHDVLRSPEGGFWNSQDADLKPGEHSAGYFALDDAGRRALGIPTIDRHRYARENGLAIRGLAAFAAVPDPAGGDATSQAKADAIEAAKWIIENRSLPGGGFRHDETDLGGPYIGDTVEMALAFVALHAIDPQGGWLDRAVMAAGFIKANFAAADGGFVTARETAAGLQPVRLRDENSSVVRLATSLVSATGNRDACPLALHAMRFLVTPLIARDRPVVGVLLPNAWARVCRPGRDGAEEALDHGHRARTPPARPGS